jgi:hypothetical protein
VKKTVTLVFTAGIAVGAVFAISWPARAQRNGTPAVRLEVIYGGTEQVPGLQHLFFIHDAKSDGCWLAEIDAFSSEPKHFAALAAAPASACKP